MSSVCSAGLAELFSQLLPTSAAVEGAVFAPSFAVAEPVSFPSAADSTMIAGMSSCNHFQCLDLSKNWSLEWGQLPGLPQNVVPVCAAERLDTANLRFAGFAAFSEASFFAALLGLH